MRAALSNRTVSSSAMQPRSGLTRPAIMLTIEVLPEPDGPNSAVTVPADYSQLGTLLVLTTVIGFVVPMLAVLFVRATRFRSA